MKILIAADDRTFGDELIKWVGNHDWPKNTEFKVVSVVEPIYIENFLDGYRPELLTDLFEERHRRAKSLVLSLGLELRQKYPTAKIDEETVDGTAKKEIVRIAKEWQSDLIVVGSHGKRGLDQFFLGSVSLAVLSHAPCSVMIVKMPVIAEESKETEKCTSKENVKTATAK